MRNWAWWSVMVITHPWEWEPRDWLLTGHVPLVWLYLLHGWLVLHGKTLFTKKISCHLY